MYVYGSYKDMMVHGLVPYRDFGFEYPPGALIPIRLAGGDDVYLSLLMLGCALLGYFFIKVGVEPAPVYPKVDYNGGVPTCSPSRSGRAFRRRCAG